MELKVVNVVHKVDYINFDLSTLEFYRNMDSQSNSQLNTSVSSTPTDFYEIQTLTKQV